MSDVPNTPAATPPRATTAGGLLRQARQAQGLHIAALAAAIKVVPRKLELLESDQFELLPDATFTRALAQTVCRTLKVDAAPILALLPPPNGHRLEQVAEGLNMPFHERPGRLVPKEWASVTSPALWLAALLVIAAVAVYVMPAGWLPSPKLAETRAPTTGVTVAAPSVVTTVAVPALLPAASAASAPAEAASAPVQESVASAESEAVAAAAAAGVLQVRASAQSWVEATDARGQSLISRLVQPGESVGLDGVLPLKLRIGNVSGTEVVFRGQPVDLGKSRDNTARIELK